jgi:hypothetical protein
MSKLSLVQHKEIAMRLSLVVTALSVISLAACSSAPKAPAAPVQANQAAAPSDATTADTTQARPRKKYCNTGSRLCSDQPDADPTVGAGLAGGLSNATSNASGGGPH